jgi:HAD superfamily hydrolase (TIGR01509 family)
MDGTLLDTEAAHRPAMAAAAELMGFELPDALFLSLVGVHRDENWRALAAHYGPDFSVERFYEAADRLFEESLAAQIPLRPGATPLLEALKAAGMPLGLATSTASPEAQNRLARAGLLPLFDTVVTSSDIRHPKPAAEPFLLAAERLGVRPAHCVAIEDSPNGLRSAHAAGMAAILVPDLIPATAETRPLAVAVLDSLDAVSALLAAARDQAPPPLSTGPALG